MGNLTPRNDGLSLLREVPVLLHELRSRRLLIAATFAVVAVAALAVGILWPKKFTSSTTILVQEDNIIQPLMEGRAVATNVTDRARIAREVVFSRKTLNQIIREGGWMDNGKEPSPIQQERLAEDVRAATQIMSPGSNLIRITYADSSPERAFRVTRAYADVFIAESLAAKERESREAYEFIAARVAEYHKKLTDAEDRLKAYRADNVDARPGTEADVNQRVIEVRGRIEQAQTQLSELQMRERALQEQLSGEAEVTSSQSRESQYRLRMAELQAELDRLLLSYTDEYPDVVRVRHQIEDLQREVLEEIEAREQLDNSPRPDSEIAVTNPLYRELRSGLSSARSDMAALRARIAENEAILESELDRGRRIAESETTLSELTRDYEVNRDVYQDLLRRRENARVSMSLDAEHRGLTFRIQEPAALPLQPSGLRLMHFAAAGLGLGVAGPLALLFLFVRLDPRVRSVGDLAQSLSVPVLVSVPRMLTSREKRAQIVHSAVAAVFVLTVLCAYGLVFWMRFERAL
jgi:polysaccharide chain length determinant protein (PEP-CTERM system associated)